MTFLSQLKANLCFFGLLILINIIFLVMRLEIPDEPFEICDLSQDRPALQAWAGRGSYATIHGRQIFYIDTQPQTQASTTSQAHQKTIVVVHGFPSSSFDYHRVLDRLQQEGRVILMDHVGYGLSEKPQKDYGYTLQTYGEDLLGLLDKLGVYRAHWIAHDMGDSVVVALLARMQRQVLWAPKFSGLFQSILFNNGGMQIHLVDLRLSQKIMLSPLGKAFSYYVGDSTLGRMFFKQQLKSIWGDDKETFEQDFNDLLRLNDCNRGVALMYKLILYLEDRYRLEHEWVEAMEILKDKIPMRFLWGGADAVSSTRIPRALQAKTGIPEWTLTVMEGIGHFTMLEDPDQWMEEVLKFISLKPTSA